MYLPPEWATQSAVMLTWPHEATIWAETLAAIDEVFVAVACAIAKYQRVIITCFDQQHQQHITELLTRANVDLTKIALFVAPSNDVWVRDHGPITVLQDERPVLLDFTFNGWGDKYPAEHDNEITRTLHSQGAFRAATLQTQDMVLEGGALEVDGQGTLLTTRSCLLSSTRNPHLNEKQITEKLQQKLGIKKILWLDFGALAGDDTDGHVDTLARFVDPHTICYVRCDDEKDEHYSSFQKMEEQLRTFTDYRDQPYQLIPLPWPRARYADYDGRRLPLTYANFLIINDAVLVPTYDDTADQDALKIIKKLFPRHDIIPIPSVPLIQWYGSLHCMTMQLPEGVVT